MDGKAFLGEPRVLISREALLHNAAIIRSTVGDTVKICAVIKADAYGHGADIVLDTLCNYDYEDLKSPAIDAVAVASIDEADHLPEDIPVPVIVLRPIENVYLGRQRSRLETAIRRGWVLTVCSNAAADDVARAAVYCKKRAQIQVMLDTGMSRSGVNPQHLPDLLNKIHALSSLKLYGFASHFASSEVRSDSFTRTQLHRFRSTLDPLLAGPALADKPLVCHIANSGGVFLWPEAHLDMVRPGLALYGIDPTGQPSTHRPLRPALKWTAPLLLTRTIHPGDGVGYGQTWHAKRESRIGLVPIGYADGYLRSLSNRAVMMVCGRPAPVVGRVSMDLTTIDLTDIPQANLGDEVTILDDDPLSPVSVYKLAEWSETIPYEIFCRIGARIHRVPIEPAQPLPSQSNEAAG